MLQMRTILDKSPIFTATFGLGLAYAPPCKQVNTEEEIPSCITTLSDLHPGDRARVLHFAIDSQPSTHHGYYRHLLAMGLVPGAILTMVRAAPLGDPLEIQICGTSLTLRKREAQILQLQRL